MDVNRCLKIGCVIKMGLQERKLFPIAEYKRIAQWQFTIECQSTDECPFLYWGWP